MWPATAVDLGGDRTFKLHSGITSEYGRYVKSLGEPCRGMATWLFNRNRFRITMRPF